MMSTEPEASNTHEAEIVALRDAGTSWHELEERFGLTRQQARYAYQRGKREERRQSRRGKRP